MDITPPLIAGQLLAAGVPPQRRRRRPKDKKKGRDLVHRLAERPLPFFGQMSLNAVEAAPEGWGRPRHFMLSPAASYSPTPSRVQYHRRWQA